MEDLSRFEWLKICNTIYELNTEPDSRIMRTKFLRNIRELIAFDCGEFCLYDPERSGCRIYDPAIVGAVPGSLQDYYDYYYQYDYLNRYFDIKTTMVYLIEDLLTEEERINNKFLNSIDPECHIMEIYLANASGFLGLISLYRTKEKRSNFSDRDLFIMRTLTPHLENILYHQNNRSQTLKTKATAADNIRFLSDREKDIFNLLLEGKSNQDIGLELSISESTVKKHISHIFEKFHVKNRVQLINSFLKNHPQ